MALAGETTGRAPERLGVVARLLVAPAHRRKGLGGTLLGVAAQAAHGRGRWPVLDVATHFDAAIALYERSGWVRAGRVDVHFRDAEPLAEYVYIGPTPGRRSSDLLGSESWRGGTSWVHWCSRSSTGGSRASGPA